MKSKISLAVVAVILVLPIALYTMFKAPATKAKVSSHQPTVIEFSMPLCSECQKMQKVTAKVEPKYSNKISFVHINASNIDKETQDKVQEFNVRVVPTTVFFDKNGKLMGRAEGSMTESQLTEFLDEILK